MKLIALGLLMLFACAADPLFNGRDLSGWIHEGPRPTFTAASGELRCSGKGFAPNWLHTVREYENFRLSFEYKLNQWAESAVILRAPRLGRPMHSGLALFLAHDFHHHTSRHVTGAIAGAREPLILQAESWGQWHRASVELRGNRLRATIDKDVVQDIELNTDTELSLRLKRGYIGFPDLGHGYAVRNIDIEDLGSEQSYVDLFDGRSLDGWKLRGAGEWSVRDGSIVGANGHGILYAPPSFKDFELTALVRSHNHANGGIFLRGSPDEKQNRGFEVQIYSPVDAVYPTGSIYGYERANITTEYEEQWFLMQILVRGAECLVRIDGTTVARFDRLPEAMQHSGRIGLQIHMENTSVEWRDLRVRRL